ncbi:MAG TPA: hypothetical protein VM942_01870 [Acidimicrobiales bacterium]|nr:hypothetical protein [Acidimicrobiales bacterium]
MVRVDCPNCGAVVELRSLSRTAEEFCPTPGCDYPLFWVRGLADVVEDDPPDMQVVRRRPGTGGLTIHSHEPCPVCKEPNRLTAVFCQRCGSDMRPAPAPPAPLPPPPRPERPPPPPPTPARRSRWSDWRVIAVLVVLLVTLELTASLVLLSRS